LYYNAPNTGSRSAHGSAVLSQEPNYNLLRVSKAGLEVEKWEIHWDELKLGTSVGAGAFAEVFEATWRSSKVAVKVLRGVFGAEAMEAFRKEAQLMVDLRPHKNLVQLLGICTNPHNCIILEYLEGGALDNYLESNSISIKEKVALIKGICAGLQHLAKERVVHRDIAARNILLDAQKNPKVSDFGMSRVLEVASTEGVTTQHIGPVRWMAPESIRSREYSEKTDVWSFGITCFEIMAEEAPHEGMDPLDIAIKIRDTGFTPTLPAATPPELARIVTACWTTDPEQRPDFDQLIASLAPL